MVIWILNGYQSFQWVKCKKGSKPGFGALPLAVLQGPIHSIYISSVDHVFVSILDVLNPAG